MVKLFISYARENKPDVEALVRDLDALGHDTWMDSSLRGGQKWWDEILQRIADSDVFVSVVSPHSLDSKACREELEWATALNKPVLPLAVGPLPDALPRELSTRQITQYSPSTREAAFALAGALGSLPPAGPLPTPLPAAPSAPLSYLTDLIDQVAQSEPLTHDQQREVLARLGPELDSADPEEARGARYVLQTFSKRDDLYADVGQSLAKLGITATPAGRTEPAAAQPAPRSGLTRTALLGLVAAGVLAAAVVIGIVATRPGGAGDHPTPDNGGPGSSSSAESLPGEPASLTGRWSGRTFGDQSLQIVADITDGPPLTANVRYPDANWGAGCTCTWTQSGSAGNTRYLKETVDAGACVESEITLVPEKDGTLDFSSTYYSQGRGRNLTIHGTLARAK